MTKSMKAICSSCGAYYSKKRLEAGFNTCLDLDYLLENKAITKKKYKEMQGKDIYEIYYRYPDDDYGSAGSWWFDSKKERDKHWDLEINKAREVNNE
jgi:hypothetical protein